MKVGFLGLGTMGAAMAANVARRGHELSVWNRSGARAAALSAALPSVRVADSAAEAARGVEVLVTMLADPASVRRVLLGEAGTPDAGAIGALSPGAVVVEMSTIDPATIRELSAAAAVRGVALVDAPVSGSRRPAEAGTLLVLAGGSDADVARVRPVLDAMGQVRYVGPSGSGSAMKLCLNGLGAHVMTGFAAMVALAERLGIDPKVAIEVFQSGAFASPLFAAKGPKILARDFTPDFRMALMLKDQDLVLAAAQASGLALPSLEAIRGLLQEAMARGLGEQDLSALYQLFAAPPR